MKSLLQCEILLAKLHFCGIEGASEDWFRPYLTKSRQEVEVKLSNTAPHFFSDWGTQKHEIPQGILGPLLFIIYINGLPLRINSASEPVSLADDTSVVISSRNFEDFCSLSHLVLSVMIKWLPVNNVVLSLDKTNIMKFITKNSEFLGLYFDNHINWQNHIEQMISK